MVNGREYREKIDSKLSYERRKRFYLFHKCIYVYVYVHDNVEVYMRCCSVWVINRIFYLFMLIVYEWMKKRIGIMN